MSQIFGPVPSRRLGFSLGVDVVPMKRCSYDCVYCQLGRTTEKTIQRGEYVPIAPLLEELRNVLSMGQQIDYITFSGSGEPTLHVRIGEMIRAIKAMTPMVVWAQVPHTSLFSPGRRVKGSLLIRLPVLEHSISTRYSPGDTVKVVLSPEWSPSSAYCSVFMSTMRTYPLMDLPDASFMLTVTRDLANTTFCRVT